eukprot:3672437-Prymnesium_polylepis.1
MFSYGALASSGKRCHGKRKVIPPVDVNGPTLKVYQSSDLQKWRSVGLRKIGGSSRFKCLTPSAFQDQYQTSSSVGVGVHASTNSLK